MSQITRINPPELGTPPGYSQIVEVHAARIIFIAGQTALDRDGNVVSRNDLQLRRSRCFETSRLRWRPAGVRRPIW